MGASRGIGRQIAIDLARNNYIGKTQQPTSPSPSSGLTRTSNAGSKDNVRSKHNTIPTRSQLITFNHQHSSARDPRSRRPSRYCSRGCPRRSTDPTCRRRDDPGIRQTRRASLQLRCDLVVVRREHAAEAVQTYAAGQPGRTLRDCAVRVTSLRKERVEGTNHGRFAAYLFAVFQGEDRLCHG